MNSISLRRAMVALALLAMVLIAAEANAQCSSCGTASYGASYAPTYSASYPATYQTYSSGWYPGYYWNRMNARLWGQPTTYVAAYPTTTYYANSVPSYSVSYAAPLSSTCQSCTAGYAPCSTCGVQQVVMRPVCTTACASPCSTCNSGCSACSTCSARVVTQASYEQPACSSCNGGVSQVQVQQSPPAAEHSPDPAPPQTFVAPPSGATSTGSPAVPADTPETERREENKPPTNGAETTPGPGAESNETTETPEGEFYKTESSDSSTMFQAPKLHDPNDRTAWRSIAPVKTAVYVQPAAYRGVSTQQRVTREQARQDAIGWTSASK